MASKTKDLRQRILEALARGDGQMLDGFDLRQTAETMYGTQADAVELLLGQEIDRFARQVSNELLESAALVSGTASATAQRRAIAQAAQDVRAAGRACKHRAQTHYNATPLSLPVSHQ